MKVIRAIDVGYSQTKFTVSGSDHNIQCRMFPSLAPLANPLALSSGIGQTRDTVCVDVEGVAYEVGPDCRLGLKARHTRILNDHYLRTPEYLALVRGALLSMNVPALDLLIVGLPVQLIASHARELAQRLHGVHPVSHGRTVEVRHVLTLAQPVGGLFQFAMGSGAYKMGGDQVTLIVDPGYYTFDWLSAVGVKIMSSRSGSVPGGVHALVDEISRAVGETLGTNYHNVDAIDRAITRNQSLRVGAREINISAYWPKAQVRIEEAVNAMANSIGDGLDVTTIVVVGGGAKLYEPAIRARFPLSNVVVALDPIFANVRGFQLAGERHASVAA
ncbi:MAG: PRTRC system protein D [Sulfobacillus sp.]